MDYPKICVAPNKQVRVDNKHYCYMLNTDANPEATCGRNDKSTNHMLHTWMTYQIDLSTHDRRGNELTGPRGGSKATRQFARYVYYDLEQKRFFGVLSNKNRERSGSMFKHGVIEGMIWSCFPDFQKRNNIPDCTIYCKDGYPAIVYIDGEQYPVDESTWPVMEAFLGFDEHWSRRFKRRNRVA